jgi:bile acid:Na+ symporter, BASS family
LEPQLLSIEKLANLLVLVLLVEMMVTAGLGVSLSELVEVVRNVPLLFRAGLANYVLIPAIAILLLYIFQARPMVAAGFLLVAVCPAAPFAPPLTAMAKGNVPVSVGLMVVLAGSSAILAPLLLTILLPLVARGASLKFDTVKIATTLLMAQLLPLGVGLLVRFKLSQVAERLRRPANLLTAFLSVVVFVLLVTLQYPTLAEIRWKSFAGICVLVLLCLAAGWIVGGRVTAIRRAVGMTTAARNVGVALVIATASFPESAAVTAVILFAIFQTIGLLAIALWIGRSRLTPQAAFSDGEIQ